MNMCNELGPAQLYGRNECSRMVVRMWMERVEGCDSTTEGKEDLIGSDRGSCLVGRTRGELVVNRHETCRASDD